LLLESLPRPDESVPPSVSRVVLRFNSRIEKSLSRAAVSVGNGRRVPLRVTTDGKPDQLVVEFPPLTPGSYTLEWRVLSADGHLTRGSFPFRVAPGP
jgi:methionine-rich copper-binding protein CopC